MGNCDSCASPRSRAPTISPFEDYVSNIPIIKHERIVSNNGNELDENDDTTSSFTNHVNYRIVPIGRKASAKSTHLPQPIADKIKKHIGI